ncbi:MAG: tandem-95 repeat protein, partial [Bermanella sp.]
DAPTSATTLNLSTLEDTLLNASIELQDVDLANEGDSHSFSANPSLGEVSFNADGTFVYTPTSNVNGKDTFTVIATDQFGEQTSTKVVVDVIAVNDAPTLANAVNLTTLEDKAINGDLQLSDPDTLNEGDTYEFAAQPTFGQVIFKQDGTFSYTPNQDANGVDTFTVTVTDSGGNSTSTQVTIDVTAVNDAPVSRDVYASISEDKTLVMALPASDVDGDVLSYRQVHSPTHGVATIDANGVLSYQPQANFFGSDNLTVEVNDGQGGTTTMALNLYISPVNDDPFAYDLVLEAQSGQAISGAIWAADYDPQDVLTYQVSAQDGADNGTLSLDSATGVFNYQSTSNFDGTDSFEVIVSDNAGGSTSLRVAVIVSEDSDLAVGNTAPQFENLIKYVNAVEDQPLEIDLRATDLEGDALSYTLDNSPSAGRGTLQATATPGIYSFVPNQNMHGSEAFRITVSDGKGGKDSLLLQVNIASVNDTPILPEQSFNATEDTLGSFAIKGTSDADGDALSFSVNEQGAHGTVTVTDAVNGYFSYAGNSNYNGTDTFEMMVDDGNGGQTIATITIDVAAVNDAPTVQSAMSLLGVEDQDATGMLITSDVDGDALSYSLDSKSAPLHGSVIVNPDGTFTYTPNANYNGQDQFILLTSDGKAIGKTT